MTSQGIMDKSIKTLLQAEMANYVKLHPFETEGRRNRKRSYQSKNKFTGLFGYSLSDVTSWMTSTFTRKVIKTIIYYVIMALVSYKVYYGFEINSASIINIVKSEELKQYLIDNLPVYSWIFSYIDKTLWYFTRYFYEWTHSALKLIEYIEMKVFDVIESKTSRFDVPDSFVDPLLYWFDPNFLSAEGRKQIERSGDAFLRLAETVPGARELSTFMGPRVMDTIEKAQQIKNLNVREEWDKMMNGQGKRKRSVKKRKVARRKSVTK
jgi:hypothetical protein